MYTGDATSAEMRLWVEQAIQTLAPCLKIQNLNRESRRQLLLTVDLLTSVWGDLQRDESLLAGRVSTLQALLALCEMTAACEEDEMPLALQAMYRMVEGWALLPQAEDTVTPLSTSAEPVAEKEPPEPVEAVEQAKQEPQAESATEVLATEEITQPVAEAAIVAPEEEVPQPAEPRVDEVRNRLSERLESLSKQLDYIANHDLSPEEVAPLLLACACRYRLIQPDAATYGREWDAAQIKRQITQLAKERFRNLWLAPMDKSVDLSEHELETLRTGYEALAQSWQMWRWYEQYGNELDKGAGAPLLESIAAPVPMVQQTWTSKQLLGKVVEQDTTKALYDAVCEIAGSRKWKLEMLASNSSRQRQLHYIRQADEHWEAAKRQVQKKEQQREALSRLRAVLHAPNPDTFEEDLLCALVDCHRAQIPYSDRELRDLVRGYDFLLENPAVPERCELAKSEQSAARKFLVNLGKHLLKTEGKEAPQEPQPEEEPSPEHNGDLLRRARQITRGKKLFVLCFNRRAEAEQNIREALEFAEVDWPDLDGGESVNSMEAHIRNADMTVVVVRYSRTHWKEARDIARKYNKQFVMATKGYGVTHLAQQIVEQCG